MKRKSFLNLRSSKVQLDENVVITFNQSLLKESPQKERISGILQELADQIPMSPHLFIYIEMFLYFGTLVFSKNRGKGKTLYPFRDLHLIPQNHYEYFRGKDVDPYYLKRVAFLMQPAYGRSSLNALWRVYMNDVSPQFRLYDCEMDDQEVEWVKENPACIRDTAYLKDLYHEVIEDDHNLQLMIKFRPFVTELHQDQQMIIKANNYVDIQLNKDKKEIRQKLIDVYPEYMFNDYHHYLMTDHEKWCLSRPGICRIE